MYGERIGALNIVASHSGKEEGGSERIKSQLLILQRQEISNPPTFGARIVSDPSHAYLSSVYKTDMGEWFLFQMSMILNDEALFKEWCQDIETMAQRIISMRSKLFELLTEKFKTPSPGPNGWNHVKEQIGMFTFTGLNRTFRLSLTFLSVVKDFELM